MGMKKILAAVSVCAAAAVSLAAMAFTTTAQTDIAYTGPSAGAVSTDTSGNEYRLNIYNIWGNDVKDINNNVTVEKQIAVTFTVSGLGEHKNNVDDAGNPTTTYEAILMGQMGGNQYWGPTDANTNVNCTPVAITGDGQYTAVFPLKEATGSIECLLLQTNINIYQLDVANPASAADCGLTIKIDSIVADGEQTPSGGDNNDLENNNNIGGNGGAATTTAANNAGGSTTTTTAANNNSGSTGGALGNSTQTDSAATGDPGVTIAVAGLVIATAAGALTQIKRKK